MAGQIINSQIASGGTSMVLSWVPQKNNLLVVLNTLQAAAPGSDITDNKSNVYSRPQQNNNTIEANIASLYYTVITASGSTFTVNYPSGGSTVVAEIYGIDRVDPLHTSNSANGEDTAATFNLTLTADNLFCIGGGWSNGAVANTPGSGYTKLQEQIDDISNERCYVQYGAKNSGTRAFDFTVPVAGWVSAGAAFNIANPNSELLLNKGLRPHPFSPGIAR